MDSGDHGEEPLHLLKCTRLRCQCHFGLGDASNFWRCMQKSCDLPSRPSGFSCRDPANQDLQAELPERFLPLDLGRHRSVEASHLHVLRVRGGLMAGQLLGAWSPVPADCWNSRSLLCRGSGFAGSTAQTASVSGRLSFARIELYAQAP